MSTIITIQSTDVVANSRADINANFAALNADKQETSSKDATGGYAGLTLFKINFKNTANTFTSFFTNANTASRTYTFPDKDGTVAMTSDVLDTVLSGYVSGAGTVSASDTILQAIQKLNGNTVALTTSSVAEGSNLYFTNARAIAATLTGYVSGAGSISSSDTILGAIQKLNGNIAGLTTTNVAEGSNLYFTTARVLATAITGYSSGAGTVASTDTILQAINKLNGNDALRETSSNKDATGGYVGMTLFKINFKNAANTFTSFFTNSNTAARTYTFQNRDGTIADDTDLALKANLISPSFTTPALGTPSSGNLSSCTADGTDAVGFRNIPQNSKSAAYTTVLADAGKHIYHPSTDANARTFTIDSNANVAYAIGTAITFINETSQVVTIAITSDTLVLAGTGTTGSRSLAQYGVATAIKVTSTRWIISGTGLT